MLIATLCVHAAGCGGRRLPPAATTRGTVTIGGRPLDAGIVSLEPLDGAGASPVGLAVERGAFPVTVVPLGRYRAVLVSTVGSSPMTADNPILPAADAPRASVEPSQRVFTEVVVAARTTSLTIAFPEEEKNPQAAAR